MLYIYVKFLERWVVDCDRELDLNDMGCEVVQRVNKEMESQSWTTKFLDINISTIGQLAASFGCCSSSILYNYNP